MLLYYNHQYLKEFLNITKKLIVHPENFLTEPKMKHVNNIVVPKIAAKWRRFADSLEFESTVVNTIDVKYRNYPEECCEEVFRDWLSLDHGIGPRTWSALLKVLKETRGCEAAAEQIKNEIKGLI